MTTDRLRVLDELDSPDLWSEIEGRRPRSEGPAPFVPRRRRAITFAVAAAVGLASILIATRVVGPTVNLGSLDMSTWRTQRVEPLRLTFRHPSQWHVQRFDELVGHLGLSGAIVSNVDHRFVHLGNTNLWWMKDVPEHAVVIALERYEGGPRPGNQDLPDSQFPLDLRQAVPMGESPAGWKRVETPFVVAGEVEVLRGWYGPKSSERDREIARRIVASIAPVADNFDGWNVGVEVEHSDSGPLEIEVGPIQGAVANDAHPWIQHTVILRNTGSETLHFDDTRFSTFLGSNHELLAADKGCGYGSDSPGAPVEAGACLLYLDAFSIPPGGSVERPVTLYRDLPGMAPLTEGRYVFRKIYRFSVGASDQKTTVHVRLIYDVRPAS